MTRWKWHVRGYYAADVPYPKRPGTLALSVAVVDDAARDLEVSIFEWRTDIGAVVIEQYVPPSAVHAVHAVSAL